MTVHPPIDRARARRIVDDAAATLEGEWLLVGGALAALWFQAERLTEDIDLVGMQGTAEERVALMDLASAHGLPVEAVNSAADYFVRQVPDWRAETVVFVRGPRALIRRPTVTLFVLLKMRRLTEKDLDDCLGALRAPREPAEQIDAARLGAALDALPPTDDAALRDRRAALRARLPRGVE